jgi:hypothetical protein
MNCGARVTRMLNKSFIRTRIRCLSANQANGDTSWRRQQLERLTSRFQDDDDQALQVNKDDELQSHWKQMEGRVVRRKSISKESAAGKVGRKNIRRTDEEVWLENGLYDLDNNK